MFYPCPQLRLYFHDGNGHPLVGGKLKTFVSNSTIPIRTAQTYRNDGGTVLNPTEITLDERGECTVFLTAGIIYRFELYDSDGALVLEQDGISVASGSGSGGSSTTIEVKSGSNGIDVQQTVMDSGVVLYTISAKKIEDAIEAEKNRAEGAESALSKSIADETERAKEAEKGLSDAIEAEKKRAEEAERTLSESISEETERAIAAEKASRTEIVAGDNITVDKTTGKDGHDIYTINGEKDAATANPLMDGTAAVGVSTKYAREDHVHPSDTSREDITNKTSVVLGTSDSKYPTDKAVAEFVNSSIATNTANYISNNGEPFTSVEQLEAYSGTVTNNDYAFVTGTDSDSNTYYDRYKATVKGSSVTWSLEYRLNNSSFTAAQWSAINSGITSALVVKIHTHSNKDVLDGITSTDIANWNGKMDRQTVGNVSEPVYLENGIAKIATNVATKTETEEAISNSVDQTYSSTSTKAQSGVAVNEAFKTRETSDSDDSYTYLGMSKNYGGNEELYWKLVSFNTANDYWTLQLEVDVSNGRKSTGSYDTEIYETKRLTICGSKSGHVAYAKEMRYVAQDINASRGYGNNIYYEISSSNLVTVYIKAVNQANVTQICRLKDVINFRGISNITWHEAANNAGTQPTNPVKFKEIYPAISSTSSNRGSDSVPVYVNNGRPRSCNSSNLKAGKDDDGNVIKNTYQKKLTFDTTPTAGSTHPVTSEGIKTALDLKANASDFTAHTGDTTVHITAAERTAWNAKASTSVATTSANGLMSKTDKEKLDGISSGANKADVSYASKKITKTINGTTTDVVAASTIIRDTNTFGNFAAVTDVTVSNIKFHTYWQVAPTSSNQVYGFAVHPTTGKLYRVYNNKGAYSVYSYDTDTNTTYSFDGTYNSSTNKAATVSSVTTRIATAKEELTAAIDSEAYARESADTTLQSNIDTVNEKGIVINEINGENVICFE